MKHRLLIVDDEGSMRNLLSRIFESKGYDCSVAEDVPSARERLLTAPLDLILCDIMMPGESSVDFIRFCKKEYPDVGIVMVTGVEDPQSAKELLEIGIYGYIIKPFANNQMMITVENALRRCELEREQRVQSERLEVMVRERTSELQKTIRHLEDTKNRIQQNEKNFRIAIEQANDAIAIARNREHLYVNRNFLKMFGYDRMEEVIGHSLKEMVHPDDRARFMSMHDQRMSGEKVATRYSFKGIRKTGESIMVEVSVARMDYQGKGASLAFLRDITESSRVQKALRESEKRLKAILENAPVGIKIVDAESRKIVEINRAGEEMIGTSRERIIGRECWEFLCPDSKDFCPVIDSGKQMLNRETTIVKADGRSMTVAKTTVPLSLDGRRHLIDIFVDITHYKQAVAGVKKAHGEKEQLIKSIPSILIGVTPDGLVSQWNPHSEKTFGIHAQEILFKPFSSCGIQWDWQRVHEAVADCLNRKASVSLEKIRFTRKDGTEGFLGVTFTPVASDDADNPGFLIMGADITNRIMLELQLDQARKLEAIGQLAAGIAHEINTPTQYVGDNIRFVQDAFNDLRPLLEHYRVLPHKLSEEGVSERILDEMKKNILSGDMDYLITEIPEALEQTLEGVERVSTIVHSMKEFSHPGATEKTAVDINRAIENTVTVSRNEWKYVASLETDLDPLLPHVSGLPAELNQVILNMITNAAHAVGEVVGDGSDEKGLITISTRARGDSVEICISDTGAGIPEKIQSRVFDPFFTTKEVGKGTGQGLAISRSVIVDKHGGSIMFESESGKGTSFIIHLPVGMNL